MSTMKDHALAYARQGWPVFPCRFDKAPMTQNGVHDATTDPAKVAEFWDKFPDANIGFHPGAVGLMVVDYDPGSDLDAVADKLNLPDCGMVAHTPRGGSHEYYRLPDGEVVPPSANRVAEHVDVRSDRSYVLLPPSRTKDGEYTWWGQDNPPPAPATLIAAAKAKDRKRAEDPATINVREDQEHNVEAFMNWLDNDAKVPREGERNNTVAATAAMGRSYALTADTTLDLIWNLFNPKLPAPLEWEEIERTVISAYGSASSPQGNMTVDYREQKKKEIIHRFRDLSQGDDQPDAHSRFKRFTLNQLIERPDPVWLVDGIISEKSFTIFYGVPGTFKSFLALDVALCLATGTECFGERDVPKAGRVLYCMGEGSFDADKRIKAWLDYNGTTLDQSMFEVIEPAPIVRIAEDVNDFLAEAQRGGDWDLVVIDTIGRTMAGLNDNSGEGARMFTEFVTAISTHLGAATLAITHSPKERPQVLLGAGTYEADADQIFNLTPVKKGERADWRNTKQKYIAPWGEAIGLQAVKHQGSLVLEQCEPQRTAKQQAEVKGAFYEQAFRAAYKNLATEHELVTWSMVRAGMVTKLAPQDGKAKTGKVLDGWWSENKDKYVTGDKAGKGGSPVVKI